MANSVEIQWQKAIEMKAKVEEFEKMLYHKMRTLEDMLDSYVRMGFPEDIASKYHCVYFSQEQQVINDVRHRMSKDHVEFLDKVITDLNDARNED